MMYEIGKRYDDKGVYTGVLKNIDDLEGNRLSGEFHIWAMPNDLSLEPANSDPYNCNHERSAYSRGKLRNIIAGLRGVCGYDGTMFWNASSVYKAIKDQNFGALSKWQLPLPEVLMGQNRLGEEVQQDNLSRYQNIGAFASTYNLDLSTDKEPRCYLSCLWMLSNGKYPRPDSDDAQSEQHIVADLTTDRGVLYARANYQAQVRLVRYEAC